MIINLNKLLTEKSHSKANQIHHLQKKKTKGRFDVRAKRTRYLINMNSSHVSKKQPTYKKNFQEIIDTQRCK